MKTIAKRIVIHLYCRNLISGFTVVRTFKRFNLSAA